MPPSWSRRSVPGTTYTDTGLAVDTFSYRVRAFDAAGNVSPYSNIATASTVSAPAGPLAAYALNEGTGTTTADASGNGDRHPAGSELDELGVEVRRVCEAATPSTVDANLTRAVHPRMIIPRYEAALAGVRERVWPSEISVTCGPRRGDRSH